MRLHQPTAGGTAFVSHHVWVVVPPPWVLTCALLVRPGLEGREAGGSVVKVLALREWTGAVSDHTPWSRPRAPPPIPPRPPPAQYQELEAGPLTRGSSNSVRMNNAFITRRRGSQK